MAAAPRRPLSPEEAEVEKRHRRTTYRASIAATAAATLTIAGILVPLLGWFGRPALVAFLADLVSPVVNAQVAQQSAPINAAFRVLLEQQIADLEDDIARLEFTRQRWLAGEPGATWTQEQVDELGKKTRKLAANRDALTAIRVAEGGRR